MGLRRLQLPCRYHFGAPAEAPFQLLQQALGRASSSAQAALLCGPQNNDRTEEEKQLRKEWHRDVRERPSRADEIARSIATAQSEPETILSPHLRADAALLPMAAGWRSWTARLSSRGRYAARP